MGSWRRSITRHRSSLSKTSVYDGREAYGKTEGWHCKGEGWREAGGGEEESRYEEQEKMEEGWCRTWIGTGLRLALHSFACRELSYNYLSACNGSTGIATANATTG